MGRRALNIGVFVMGFLIGCVHMLVPPVRDNDGSELQSYEVTPGSGDTNAKENAVFKYGCRDEEIVSFWEQLDKKQFPRQQKAQLAKQDSERATEEFAEFERTFGCSYFLGVDREDLNGDGVDELKVQGEGGMRNWPTYIFQQTDHGLKMILAEAWTFDEPTDGTGERGFRNLVFSTNYSGSDRAITHYKFIGNSYVPVKCFGESHFVDRNGDMVPVDKPVLTRISCKSEKRVQP